MPTPSPLGQTMISMPAKPAATAAQRCGPTCSPRNSTDSTITSSGETKLIANRSASGIRLKPRIASTAEASSARARPSCSAGRAVAAIRRKQDGPAISSIGSAWKV